MSMKNPLTLAEIEPATFRFVGSSTGILQRRTLTSKRFVTLHHLLCALLVAMYCTAVFFRQYYSRANFYLHIKFCLVFLSAIIISVLERNQPSITNSQHTTTTKSKTNNESLLKSSN